MGDVVEGDLGERRHDVGDQHLLREPDDEDARADRGAPERLPALVELAGDGLVADDRAGDELGEERDVERDVDRIAVGAKAPAVHVDDVAQAVEGEERDAERQLDVGPAEVEPQRLHRVGEIGGDEIGVFEDAEREEIDGDGESQRPVAARALVAVDQDRRDIIEDDREQEDQQEARLAPGVEDEREEQRDDVLADHGRGQRVSRR